MVTVTECRPADKGRWILTFDNGITFPLYRSEVRQFKLQEEAAVTDEAFTRLMEDVVGKRAKKRALHLLERMDRTEYQLRRKLITGGYPQVCVDAAIDYVKSYHYLDDHRYACSYIRCSQEKMSRRQMKMKLAEKGVAADVIEHALLESYEADEQEQIESLLAKRGFVPDEADDREFQRTYRYLLRRGFQSCDILRAMKT
jgi:regulatory protein